MAPSSSPRGEVPAVRNGLARWAGSDLNATDGPRCAMGATIDFDAIATGTNPSAGYFAAWPARAAGPRHHFAGTPRGHATRPPLLVR